VVYTSASEGLQVRKNMFYRFFSEVVVTILANLFLGLTIQSRRR
jgi:hypothetical protein